MTEKKKSRGETSEVKIVSDEQSFPEVLIYYEYAQKLAERQAILLACPGPPPPILVKQLRGVSAGLVIENRDIRRIADYLDLKEKERLERQITTVVLALERKVYLPLEDVYVPPTGSYVADDGTYKLGAMRKFARFLKKIIEKTPYMTSLLSNPDIAVELVDWKVFRNVNGAFLNVKRGIIRNDDFPQKGYVLTLHDRKTDEILVNQTYHDHYSIFLLYEQFFSMFTVTVNGLEPTYGDCFDYLLLHRILFGLPTDGDAMLLA